MRKAIKYFTIAIVLFLSVAETLAQCGCGAGAAAGGLTPASGAANVGVLREGFFRASLFYKYSYGNEYFRGDVPAEPDLPIAYKSNYLYLVLGYGFTNAFTVESEVGYYPQKYQDFKYYEKTASGFSRALLSAKYNVLFDLKREIEISLGAGAIAPLSESPESAPRHLPASSGAFGAATQAFVHKGFKDIDARLIFYYRGEYYGENSQDYMYGDYHNLSVFATKAILGDLSAILETRSEFRRKDRASGDIVCDSGGYYLTISPQLNYVAGELNFSVIADFPVYSYLNGKQLATAAAVAFNLTWQGKVVD